MNHGYIESFRNTDLVWHFQWLVNGAKPEDFDTALGFFRFGKDGAMIDEYPLDKVDDLSAFRLKIPSIRNNYYPGTYEFSVTVEPPFGEEGTYEVLAKGLLVINEESPA